MSSAVILPPDAVFAHKANVVSLVANADEDVPTSDAGWTLALNPSAGREWPRIITARSFQGYPFAMSIRWKAGGSGEAGKVDVTAEGGCARVALTASALEIYVANLVEATSTVFVGIANGVSEGANRKRWVKRFSALPNGGASPQSIVVPPFATNVRVLTNDPGQTGDVVITGLTKSGVVVASKVANDVDPMPTSLITTVRLTNNGTATISEGLVVFDLEF